MRTELSSLVVVGILLLGGCQPWYRDDLRRGRSALHARSDAALLDEARQEHDAGNHGQAVKLARAALAKDPSDGGRHLALARYLIAAGRYGEARWIATRGLEVSGLAELRPIVIEACLADELTGAALDLVEPATLASAAATGIPGTAELAQIELLSTANPAQALALYRTWQTTYGAPLHPLLSAAADRVVGAAWRDSQTRALHEALLAEAYLEASAGHSEIALALYSHLLPKVPWEAFALHAPLFFRAAAAATDPSDIDPTAYNLAMSADQDLRNRRYGRAVDKYRRVVSLAPWWRTAHENLATLLTLLGRAEEARRVSDWVSRLEAAPGPQPVRAALVGRSAWEMARSVLPVDLKIVAGFDLVSARATKLYRRSISMILQRAGIAKLVEQMKASCGVDAMGSIDALVVAFDEQGVGVVFAQLRGLEAGVLADCATMTLRAQGESITIARKAHQEGAVIEFSSAEREKRTYAALFGNVIAMGINPNDESGLHKMVGGNGALALLPTFGAAVANVDPSALVWALLLGPEPMDGGTATLMNAHLRSAAGGYQLDWRTLMTSTAEAKASAAAKQQQLGGLSTSPPRALARLAQALRVEAGGHEVLIRGALSEAEVLPLLELLFQ